MPIGGGEVLTSRESRVAVIVTTGVTARLNDNGRCPAKPVGVRTKNDVSPVGCTTLRSVAEFEVTTNDAFCTVTTTVLVPAAEVRTVTPMIADSACPATVRV